MKSLRYVICAAVLAMAALTLPAAGAYAADPAAQASETAYAQIKKEINRDTVRYKYETKDIWCENGGKKIFGVAYIPETGKKKLPLVIFSHELSATHETGIRYAEELASRGAAVYLFDYRGGGPKSRSDGKTTEMSVMTEVSDLEHVLAAAKKWDFVDKDKIAIIGASQGGLVASLTAGRHADELKGLVLIYPAFVIKDELHKHFTSLAEVPDEMMYNGWIKVGRRYVTDSWDQDPYEGTKNFKKPVLILHGDEDKDVAPYYSIEAARRYPDAQLHMIYGTGHMFPERKSFEEARDYVVKYMQDIGMIK